MLVVGREVSDFLCPLFKSLREQRILRVDLFEFRDKKYLKKAAKDSFDEVLNLSLNVNSYAKSFVLSSIFSSVFFSSLLKSKSIKEALRRAVLHRAITPIVEKYDAVHIFFITPELFLLFDAFAKAKKLVVSMWGSDLFQCNDNFPHPEHLRLLNMAHHVTVHNKEMTEIFLSKYGRHLEDKVSQMLVVNDKRVLEKYSKLIANKPELIASFKQRYNIRSGSRLVVIGHCAHDVDNHLAIIRSLAKRIADLKDKVCLVLPMTYGEERPGYIDEARRLCEEFGFEHIVLTNYMSDEEMLELRLASEVLLRLSKIDAFSLSLCETLAAENICVTGAWLPYGKLRGNGVHCEEVYEMETVGDTLVHIVNNYEEYAARCIKNPERVMSVFEEEKSVEKVFKIYQG